MIDNCAFCGRRIQTRLPKGGDGSVRLARAHLSSADVLLNQVRKDPVSKEDHPCQGTGTPTKSWGANTLDMSSRVRRARKLTVHQKIMRAAKKLTGIRLTASEVFALSRDNAIYACAQEDDAR